MEASLPRPIRLLTVSGSLQRRSANRAALDASAAVATAAGAVVDDYGALAAVPAFNADDADDADEAIPAVDELRRQVASADAVLIAVPEYAGALAGAVKNALDWLVGTGELYRKPVAVISAGTSGGLHARRMAAQTLTWQGAYVVADLGIAFPRTKFDDAGRITDEATRAAITDVVTVLLDATHAPAGERVRRATDVVERLGVDIAHVVPVA